MALHQSDIRSRGRYCVSESLKVLSQDQASYKANVTKPHLRILGCSTNLRCGGSSSQVAIQVLLVGIAIVLDPQLGPSTIISYAILKSILRAPSVWSIKPTGFS